MARSALPRVRVFHVLSMGKPGKPNHARGRCPHAGHKLLRETGPWPPTSRPGAQGQRL